MPTVSGYAKLDCLVCESETSPVLSIPGYTQLMFAFLLKGFCCAQTSNLTDAKHFWICKTHVFCTSQWFYCLTHLIHVFEIFQPLDPHP